MAGSLALIVGVAVSFLTARPKTKVKLTIKLDGKDYPVEVDKGGSVEWSGKMYVSSDVRPHAPLIAVCC